MRFKAPQPPDSWRGIRDATKFGKKCVQAGGAFPENATSEDCLSVNVYVPINKTSPSSPSSPTAVMVWIHGGGFSNGAGSEYDVTQLAQRGVVVVSLNYRLDALGFLSTEDDVLPGNYGLLDQAMALKWVYDNVHTFQVCLLLVSCCFVYFYDVRTSQGDRERITVFGPGAGAASAGLLAVMPRSRSMVRRVIAMSGSPLADWGVIQ